MHGCCVASTDCIAASRAEAVSNQVHIILSPPPLVHAGSRIGSVPFPTAGELG